ncbi:MAG: nucleoside hydrolase [Pelolinea sp.]|nr:nucleoside hydrolase [Pelolinea sp.]
MPRKVIIDVDTGLDDAVALLLAIRSSELDVRGITCVNGNVDLINVIANTLRVVDYSGKDIPVYSGASTAMIAEESEDAAHVHGRDGLGGIPFTKSKRSIEKEHAVDFIVNTFMEADEPMDWITLGPLTNAALAYLKEPRIAEKIRLLTMMAGGVDSGNTTPAAEFNVFADPEAARIILSSNIHKLMVPLDPLFAGGHLSRENVEKIINASHLPWCEMAGKIFSCNVQMVEKLGVKREIGQGAVSPPDLLAVAVAINPAIANIKEFWVEVETKGEFSRGMTIFDRRKIWRAKNIPQNKKADVALSVDQKKYSEMVLGTWLGPEKSL